jgi:hypothetical protein
MVQHPILSSRPIVVLPIGTRLRLERRDIWTGRWRALVRDEFGPKPARRGILVVSI